MLCENVRILSAKWQLKFVKKDEIRLKVGNQQLNIKGSKTLATSSKNVAKM